MKNSKAFEPHFQSVLISHILQILSALEEHVVNNDYKIMINNMYLTIVIVLLMFTICYNFKKNLCYICIFEIIVYFLRGNLTLLIAVLPMLKFPSENGFHS